MKARGNLTIYERSVFSKQIDVGRFHRSQIPFEGEPHYLVQSLSQGEYPLDRTLAESAEYSNRGFLLLIIAVIIILIGGCFAIAASSSATNPVSAAEKLFYVD
jgi:hypothetical protein